MYIWFTHTLVYDYDDCLISIPVQCYPVEGDSECLGRERVRFAVQAHHRLGWGACVLWAPGTIILRTIPRACQGREGRAGGTQLSPGEARGRRAPAGQPVGARCSCSTDLCLGALCYSLSQNHVPRLVGRVRRWEQADSVDLLAPFQSLSVQQGH